MLHFQVLVSDGKYDSASNKTEKSDDGHDDDSSAQETKDASDGTAAVAVTVGCKSCGSQDTPTGLSSSLTSGVFSASSNSSEIKDHHSSTEKSL